eukprot:1819197-Rhodomonas_salina.3
MMIRRTHKQQRRQHACQGVRGQEAQEAQVIRCLFCHILEPGLRETGALRPRVCSRARRQCPGPAPPQAAAAHDPPPDSPALPPNTPAPASRSCQRPLSRSCSQTSGPAPQLCRGAWPDPRPSLAHLEGCDLLHHDLGLAPHAPRSVLRLRAAPPPPSPPGACGSSTRSAEMRATTWRRRRRWPSNSKDWCRRSCSGAPS